MQGEARMAPGMKRLEPAGNLAGRFGGWFAIVSMPAVLDRLQMQDDPAVKLLVR